MKFHFRWAGVALFVATVGLSSVAEAAFVHRDGGLIYDTNLNIEFNVDGSGTKDAPDLNYYVRKYNFYYDSLYAYHRGNGHYVRAVRSGDVAAVPHPTACWLFGSGLIGLFGIARRKAA